MDWLALLIAGAFETFAVIMINRLSARRSWQTLALIAVGLGGGLGFLGYSLQTIAMGTGYAVWTGISVIGSSIIGMFYFGESKNAKRIFYISLILVSSIGLKLVS